MSLSAVRPGASPEEAKGYELKVTHAPRQPFPGDTSYTSHVLAVQRNKAAAAWLAPRRADTSFPSPRPRAVPRGSASFKSDLVRTRDLGRLRSLKQGAEPQLGSPHLAVRALTGKPFAARRPRQTGSRKDEKGMEAPHCRSTPRHLHPAPSAAVALPHPHAGCAPPRRSHPEAQQPLCALCGSARLLDST